MTTETEKRDRIISLASALFACVSPRERSYNKHIQCRQLAIEIVEWIEAIRNAKKRRTKMETRSKVQKV
jgi:hypothetical protein